MQTTDDNSTTAMNNLTAAHDKVAEWCRKVMEEPEPDLAKVKEVMKFLKDNRIEVGVVKPDSDLDEAARLAEEKIRTDSAKGGEDLIKLFPYAKAFPKNTDDEPYVAAFF